HRQPDQGRDQGGYACPGPELRKVRRFARAAFLEQLVNKHADNPESKLKPGIGKTGRAILHSLVSRVFCHVERRRDISTFSRPGKGAKTKSEIPRLRSE